MLVSRERLGYYSDAVATELRRKDLAVTIRVASDADPNGASTVQPARGNIGEVLSGDQRHCPTGQRIIERAHVLCLLGGEERTRPRETRRAVKLDRSLDAVRIAGQAPLRARRRHLRHLLGWTERRLRLPRGINDVGVAIIWTRPR